MLRFHLESATFRNWHENQLDVHMELLYKKETREPISSIYVKQVKEPVLDINWHFHEEYELIYIIEGNGVRLVGDNISNFQSGELVLVGPYLPHLWRTTENISEVDRIIIKFDEQPNGINIFSLPEFEKIRILFAKASRGISFNKAACQLVHDYLLAIAKVDGELKWINLLQILKILSEIQDVEYLSSPYMKIAAHNIEEKRLSTVINYISEFYNRDISLDKMAELASMTTQSFCRYFKKRTNKTFIQFLNEYRIGKACVLLMENELTITEIWCELGFNTSTNFNRIFKNMYRCTPMEYRKKYTNRGNNHN